MAVLNYSKTYQEVLTDLGLNNIQELSDRTKFPEANTGNFVKLFFAGDGNIITHGVNYLPIFTQSNIGKGMVPVNNSLENKNLDFLRGDGTWANITTSDLPIWQLGDLYDNTKIPNASTVKLWVDSSFAANDAMRFRGVITDASELPTEWETGDTYRIGKSGMYFSKVGEVGDMLICITDGSTKDLDYHLHWTIVLNNIEGITTVKVNNTTISLYSNNNSNVGQTYLIYSPTTNGYGKSQVLINADNTNGAPRWATLNEGLSINTIGSGAMLALNKASNLYLGGVIIDNIGQSGGKVTLGDTISISSGGNIYLTPTNVSNALGFMPIHPDELQDALTRASREKDGLAPMFDNLIAPSITSGTWLLGVNKGANNESDLFGWFGVPETALKDTWRRVLIGNIDIEDSVLQINPSGDVCVNVDDNPTDDLVSISFGLSWYNISDGVYETAL